MLRRLWNKVFPEPSPEAVEILQESEKKLEEVQSQEAEIQRVTSYLAARRQQNHFGGTLTISFTPRRGNV